MSVQSVLISLGINTWNHEESRRKKTSSCVRWIFIVFFMVPGGFFFMVPGRFFMVSGRFYGLSWFQVGFSWFKDSFFFFIVFQGSSLVLHG